MRLAKTAIVIAASLCTLVGSSSIAGDEPHPWGNKDIHIDYVDPIDSSHSEPRPFDDSSKYNYDDMSFRNVNGAFSFSTGVYTSTSAASLAICDDIPFPYGTISATVRSTNATDTGLVFGLVDNGASSFWENGVSYYFYFLGQGGNCYLGKVTNGVWSALNIVSGSAVDPSKDYKIKVVLKSNKISCYMDDVLKFSFKDDAFLEGTKFGIRTGASSITFKDVMATSEYLYE